MKATLLALALGLFGTTVAIHAEDANTAAAPSDATVKSESSAETNVAGKKHRKHHMKKVKKSKGADGSMSSTTEEKKSTEAPGGAAPAAPTEGAPGAQ